jgi:hypothetical protein
MYVRGLENATIMVDSLHERIKEYHGWGGGGRGEIGSHCSEPGSWFSWDRSMWGTHGCRERGVCSDHRERRP